MEIVIATVFPRCMYLCIKQNNNYKAFRERIPPPGLSYSCELGCIVWSHGQDYGQKAVQESYSV